MQCVIWVTLQVATMGTRRKLSVSVNSCGICSGVLKVSFTVVYCEEAVNDCSMASRAAGWQPP